MSKSKAWIFAATLMSPGFLAVPVFAQTATLHQIVVTARERKELAHNVPISESVFTRQTITSAAIHSPRSFIAMVPNMTLVETQNVGNAFVTLRGISQARNSEPSVAVIVDGVEETSPEEFDTQLYNVKQIEVLKGPQGALYGRDAIAGAIIIKTVPPQKHFGGRVKVGVGNGPSERVDSTVTGPVNASHTLLYRAGLDFYNTRGYLENVYLHRKADPYRDYAGRLRLLWTPNKKFTADWRFFYDRVQTTAYYFVIPRNNESNPFSTFTTPPNANDITSPIQTNNLGMDNRDILDTSLKLDYNPGYGTFRSITDYDQTKEIDTGDAYDFRPIKSSIAYNYFFASVPASLGGPFDESQSQFVRVRSWSEDVRFTSPSNRAFRWITGFYFLHKERFISTDNIVDRGLGVPRVYETPIVNPNNPFATNTNVTFLADFQNSNAWAWYGDATYTLSKQWQIDTALRFDSDTESDTTRTPQQFLPDPAAYTGEVRKHTWSAWQPKFTLRYQPNSNWTIYADWSRGFRSGGFNQTGVAAVAKASGILGVGDTFKAEIADTYELGVKGDMFHHRLSVKADLFHTHTQNGYFFVYLAANSTQNLGNLNATYKGGEIELTARPTNRLEVYAGYGYTDSKITAMADPTVLGNEAPLVTRDTINAGAMYTQPIKEGLAATMRLDFHEIGRTWWDPYNVTSRNPVPLVNLRIALEGGRWTLALWSKNLTNKIYNAEFSPGGFLWRALPRRYGLSYEYRF